MAVSTDAEFCVVAAVGRGAVTAAGEAAWMTIGAGDCARAPKIEIVATIDMQKICRIAVRIIFPVSNRFARRVWSRRLRPVCCRSSPGYQRFALVAPVLP